MIDHAVLVTALILERPLCVRCIATKAALSVAELDRAIGRVEAVLTVRRNRRRCDACGGRDAVLLVDRP